MLNCYYMKLLPLSFDWVSLRQGCSEPHLPSCATQFLRLQSSFTHQCLTLLIAPSSQFLALVHSLDHCPVTFSYPPVQLSAPCVCPARWVFLCLSEPTRFHISQNLMSKHLRISSNHDTKSLITSIHSENCILFAASCSPPLSHLFYL